jgi:hypothetical protein
MQDMLKLEQLAWLSSYLWQEAHRAHTGRPNYFGVCQSNGYLVGLVGGKPMAVRRHMTSGAGVCVPISTGIHRDSEEGPSKSGELTSSANSPA